jgi:hypothetical protein
MLKLTQQVLTMLRRSKDQEIWIVVWDYVRRSTDGKFCKISEYMTAPAEVLEAAGHSEARRDEVLRVLVQALQTGDSAMLEPEF